MPIPPRGSEQETDRPCNQLEESDKGDYDMIFLTEIGLTPGGSSTVHIYTQTIHRTTQSTQTMHRTTHFTN